MTEWLVGRMTDVGRDPFNQNFQKFRSNTQWIGSVQPEKFPNIWSTFWGGPLFLVGPVWILVEWIVPVISETVMAKNVDCCWPVVLDLQAHFLIIWTIVIRGDWLWKAANINDKNNSAAVYVQSTVKVHNPLFSVGKLLRNKLMQRFNWSIQSKW